MNKKRLVLIIAALALLTLIVKYSSSLFGGLDLLAHITAPLVFGCVIAYILNILVTAIEKIPLFSRQDSPLYKCRRPFSILGALAIIIAIIVLVILIVIPQLLQTIGVLAKEIPTAFARLADWLSSKDTFWPQIQNILSSLEINWPQLLQKAATYLSNGLSDIFSSTLYIVSSISSLIINLVVAVIFAIYLLAGKEKLFRQFKLLAKTYLSSRIYRPFCLILSTAHDTFTRFIVGQCTEAVILGSLCALGMILFRFPYASMVGTLIGATALLPIVGAYIGGAVGAFMIFTVDPLKAIGFLIFLVLLQQIEGNLIYPRVVGSSVGLPGIWVLCAVTIGGGLGGIVGMLLAVPVTATLYKLLQKDVRRRQTDISYHCSPPQEDCDTP